MNKQQDQEKEGKTGSIPNEQLKGSDADKAYAEVGDAGETQATEDQTDAQADVPEGSDADTDS